MSLCNTRQNKEHNIEGNEEDPIGTFQPKPQASDDYKGAGQRGQQEDGGQELHLCKVELERRVCVCVCEV